MDLRGLRDPGNHKGLFYSWGMFFVGFFFWGDLRGLGVRLFLPEDLRGLGGDCFTAKGLFFVGI